MVKLIEDNREAIAQACERHGVRTLELFGSAATGRFDAATSDVDFVVEFLPRESGHAAAYFGLLEDLQDIVGRSVDLVVSRAITNPYFRATVDQSRVSLYQRAA